MNYAWRIENGAIQVLPREFTCLHPSDDVIATFPIHWNDKGGYDVSSARVLAELLIRAIGLADAGAPIGEGLDD